MEVGFRLRLQPKPTKKEFDVIIVGGGPAGLTAALYSARFVLDTLIITKDVGGQLTDAGEVDDYPGIPSIPGPDLAQKFEAHVTKYRVPILRDKVVDVKKVGDKFTVYTSRGDTYVGKAVIIAVGSERRKLNVPGEREFSGKGVSYCAPCDAPLFKGKTTAVVGGGNAALQAALLMASYSPKVYLIHRRNQFRAFPIYVDLLSKTNNIVPILEHVVEEIGGTKHVEWVLIKNVKTGETRKLSVEGIIIEIGYEPQVELFERIGLALDDKGYIVVNPGQETNIEGLFAAGDCTSGKCKKKFDQIVTAAAEGAVAALSAYEYIMKKWGSVSTKSRYVKGMGY